MAIATEHTSQNASRRLGPRAWLRKLSLPGLEQWASQKLKGSSCSRRRPEILSSSMQRTDQWPSLGESRSFFTRDMLLCTDFDALDYSSDELLHTSLELFRQSNVLDSLNVSESTIKTFLLKVRQHMPSNTYHNWWHCVDVAQATFCFGNLCGMFDRMPPCFRFASLIAAFCHDLEHPGLAKRDFCECNESVVALFGGSSLLERRHAFIAGQVLSSTDLDLQSQLGTEVYFNLLDAVSNAILATDMERHEEFVKIMESGMAADADFRLEMCLLLKLADLSNVARPHAISRRWGWLVSQEILQPSMLSSQNAVGRAQLVASFIDSVATRFYAAAAAVYPELSVLHCAVAENLKAWRETEDQDLEAALRLGHNRPMDEGSVDETGRSDDADVVKRCTPPLLTGAASVVSLIPVATPDPGVVRQRVASWVASCE